MAHLMAHGSPAGWRGPRRDPTHRGKSVTLAFFASCPWNEKAPSRKGTGPYTKQR